MTDRRLPRLELMKEPVRMLRHAGESTGRRLSENESALLRLLFWEPNPLRQDEILEGLATLRRMRGNTRESQSLAPMIRYIRQAAGNEAVETVNGYMAGGERESRARYLGKFEHVSVDANQYRELCDEVLTRLESGGGEAWLAPERLPSDFGARPAVLADGTECDELEMWDEALEQHPMNPGVDLPRFQAASRAYDEFAELTWTLVKAVALGYVCRYLETGNDAWLAKAESRLQKLDRDGDIPDEIWLLRFRIVASQPSWRLDLNAMRYRYLSANHRNATDEALAEMTMPKDLEAFFDDLKEARTGSGTPLPHTLLRPRAEKQPDWTDEAVAEVGGAQAVEAALGVGDQRGTPSPAAASPYPHGIPRQSPDPSLLEVATMLGITPASAVALRSSNATPVDCCKQVDKRLWFSGIMANKWVLDPEAHEAFDSLLTELDTYDETDPLCRLLIVDPDSHSGAKLKRRGLISDRELRSLPVLRDLVRKHPSFEVRMYDTLPIFRLIIVDSVFVTVAPYLNVLPDLIPDQGWGVPHLVLKPSAEYPLAHSFITLFEQNWLSCRNRPLRMV